MVTTTYVEKSSKHTSSAIEWWSVRSRDHLVFVGAVVAVGWITEDHNNIGLLQGFGFVEGELRVTRPNRERHVCHAPAKNDAFQDDSILSMNKVFDEKREIETKV